MSKIITVVKTQLARCDYKITLISHGKQVKADEITGDQGQAAAYALNLKCNNPGAKIIAPNDVMTIIKGAL